MNNNQPQFLATDAWLLTSIYGAARGGEPTLARVIGTGDFINHAIFTLYELNGGLRRLHEAGYLRVEGGTYLLTEKGKEITEIDKKAKKGPFEHMETIRKRLHATEWGPRVLPGVTDDDAGAYVTEDTFRKAYAEYTMSLKRAK